MPTPLVNKIEATRPATTAVSTRVDLRTLASLALFWQEKGQPIRSQSELIRLSLEAFLQVLVVNNQAQNIASQEAAMDLLNRCGLGSGLRLRRQALEKLSIEIAETWKQVQDENEGDTSGIAGISPRQS